MQSIKDSGISEIISRAENIIDELNDGATFSSSENFTDQIAEALYTHGYIQYQGGRYEDAANTFGYIIFNDPINIRAIRGLASSLQMQGRYSQALFFLNFAALADDDNADVSLQIVECFLRLGQRRDALALLGKIEVALAKDPKDDYFKKRVDGFRSLLGDK